MNRILDKILGVTFAGWLALFWLSYGLGKPVPAVVGNRTLTTYPDASLAPMSPAWMHRLSDWALEHSPFRLRFIVERNRFMYLAAKNLQPLPLSPGRSEICVGKDGWLFTIDEAPDRHSRRDQESMVDDALDIARAVKASGRRFILMPIPDKSAVYPEHTGVLLNWAYAPAVRSKMRSLLAKGFAESPDLRECYLPLWAAYDQARHDGAGLLYWEQDSHWNPAGMLVTLPRLVEQLQPGAWDPSVIHRSGVLLHHGDLMENFLLQPDTTTGQDYNIARPSPVTVEDHRVRGMDLGPIRRYQTSDPRSIKGRILIISDSFIEGAEYLLAPWFEDVTFAHCNCVYSQELGDHIQQCDTLILTSVERYLRIRLKSWAADDCGYLKKHLQKREAHR